MESNQRFTNPDASWWYHGKSLKLSQDYYNSYYFFSNLFLGGISVGSDDENNLGFLQYHGGHLIKGVRIILRLLSFFVFIVQN